MPIENNSWSIHGLDIYFQRDIISESEDILKLGLLFGEDVGATTEDFPAVLSFQHKLIQEYLAAIYIAEKSQWDTTATFLKEILPTWEEISNHHEVVQFACGILGENDADPLIAYMAMFFKKHIYEELSQIGRIIQGSVKPNRIILASCQKESGTKCMYLSVYPDSRHTLGEMLDNCSLVYIDDIEEKDALQLNPNSPAQIIVDRQENYQDKLDRDKKIISYWGNSEKFDRLWQALYSIRANLTVLVLDNFASVNVTKISHFPNLRYLSITSCICSEEAGEDLAESINSWGPNPKLISCVLNNVPMPRSVMIALCKCTELERLSLACCDISGKLSEFIASPPPALIQLVLAHCSLNASDIDHITQAIRVHRLNHLQKLLIPGNHVGEGAVGSLLKALIAARPKKQFLLDLCDTAECENDLILSEEFRNEWEPKLKDNNIVVNWYNFTHPISPLCPTLLEDEFLNSLYPDEYFFPLV